MFDENDVGIPKKSYVYSEGLESVKQKNITYFNWIGRVEVL